MKFFHLKNPFEIENHQALDMQPGGSILDAAKKVWGDSNEEFSVPTVCSLNGELVLRSEWEKTKIYEKDILAFSTCIAGPVEIIAAVIAVTAIAAAFYLGYNIPPPQVPGQIPEPDPAYTLRGQTNRLRLGDPIEEYYGRCRIYPSVAAISYNRYVDNQQFFYGLYCLGQGEYQIDQVYIEDTEIENFQETEFQIYGPGENVTLFRDNVVTSAEVSDIELFGTNEPDYVGISGPFTVNQSGTQVDRIEIDVSLPNGLFSINDSGGLSTITAQAQFEYREIDNNGNPVGTWQVLSFFDKTLRTNTPQRFTLGIDVSPGRYEVQGFRVNPADTNFRNQDTVKWQTLKGFLPNTSNYGNVTLFALKARATNNLNDSSGRRLNMFATRKLPVWDGTSWSIPTATRSAVWAIANMLRSSNGGNLSDEFLDLDNFITVDSTLNSEGRNFDWGFDSRSTVWTDVQVASRAVRGRVLPSGSTIYIALERAQTLPKAIFGPDNIVKDSFQWDVKLRNDNEYDGLEVEYVDSQTWRNETVKAVLDDSSGNFLEPLKVPGITDRDFAWREGIYEERKKRFVREKISFKTGLEGFIPSWGDMIMVHHPIPNWSQSGRVLQANFFFDLLIGGVRQEWILDREIFLEQPGENRIFVKGVNGETSGPYKIEKYGPFNDRIYLEENEPSIFIEADPRTEEKPIFLLGTENQEGKKIIVSNVKVSDSEEITIEGTNYDERIFEDDTNVAVPLSSPTSLPLVSIDAITGLSVSEPEKSQLILRWNAVEQATSYIVEWSDNDVEYLNQSFVSDNQFSINVLYIPMHFRVASVTELGVGKWSYIVFDSAKASNFTPQTPINLSGESGSDYIALSWKASEFATFYEISITDEDPLGANPEPQDADKISEVNQVLIPGLSQNTQKYFQIRAVNELADESKLISSWSTPFQISTSAAIGTNFYAPTEPSNPNVDGAVWFDTSDSNRIHIWDNSAQSWVDSQYILSVLELVGVIGANEIISNQANIADAIITDAKIANLSAGKITSGNISTAILNLLNTGQIKSDNFVSGSTGFSISGDGSAELNDVTVRGVLDASKIVTDGVRLYNSAYLTKPGFPIAKNFHSDYSGAWSGHVIDLSAYFLSGVQEPTGTENQRLLKTNSRIKVFFGGITQFGDSSGWRDGQIYMNFQWKLGTSSTWNDMQGFSSSGSRSDGTGVCTSFIGVETIAVPINEKLEFRAFMQGIISGRQNEARIKDWVFEVDCDNW